MSKCVLLYGAFNPPHKGHERNFEVAKKLANEKDCKLIISTSRVHDSENLLPFNLKKDILETMFPDHEILAPEDTRGGIFSAILSLDSSIISVTLCVGEDRFERFKEINTKYDLAKYCNKSFVEVVSTGPRKVDLSSTHMVETAKNRQFDEFEKMCSDRLSYGQKQEMFSTINYYLEFL